MEPSSVDIRVICVICSNVWNGKFKRGIVEMTYTRLLELSP